MPVNDLLPARARSSGAVHRGSDPWWRQPPVSAGRGPRFNFETSSAGMRSSAPEARQLAVGRTLRQVDRLGGVFCHTRRRALRNLYQPDARSAPPAALRGSTCRSSSAAIRTCSSTVRSGAPRGECEQRQDAVARRGPTGSCWDRMCSCSTRRTISRRRPRASGTRAIHKRTISPPATCCSHLQRRRRSRRLPASS